MCFVCIFRVFSDVLHYFLFYFFETLLRIYLIFLYFFFLRYLQMKTELSRHK